MAATLVLLGVQPLRAQSRLLGLLTLPQVFGNGPCTPFQPQTIHLFEGPDQAKPVGRIYVEKYWNIQGQACDGLVVHVHMEGRQPQELTTEEYGYEAPAAMVFARKHPWYKVRTGEGDAWMHAEPQNRYLAMEELLKDQLTYLTGAWTGVFYATPGGRTFKPRAVEEQATIAVLRWARVRNEAWLLVETTPGCFVEDPRTFQKIRGWVPQYGRDSEPTVWFFSRGC
jgi:hypothetical protein